LITDISRASFFANIPTTDLAAMRDFYERVLGLELAREHPGGVAFRTGQSYIELYRSPAAGQAQHTLGSFEVDDIDAAVAALRERGVAFEEYDLPELETVGGIALFPGGTRVAWFKDPEGNTLGIVQPTLTSRLVTFPASES
jgi:catechol 2,3-dioxygenase-like lactoylglutathione lyase family enzyme